METPNESFYRKSRRAWYLQVGKRQIKLAESKAESWAKWHLIDGFWGSRGIQEGKCQNDL